MLTVYSTHGSPGASTTAIYLAVQWASSGRPVLLIEADTAAGSLSQKLGIQFTPGAASFVASGKPVTAANLIEHAQDVLFSDLHIMPAPSSPSGARMIAERFAQLGEELRDIADSEMAIIVDGGRLTAEARTSELTTSAAAVLIVARDNTEFPSLEHVSGVLVDEASQPGPLGLAAAIGPSRLSATEWSSNHGLRLVGNVELSNERGTDLTMFISRGKRKARKLKGSLEKLADALYEYACPASAAVPRARLPTLRPEPDADAADALGDGAEGALADEPGDLLAGVSHPAAPASAPLPPAAATMPPPVPAYEAAYEQYGTDAPAPSPVQPPPQYEQPAADPPPMRPVEMPPPEAPTVPTGSFRTWAVHLFGESAGGDPDEHRPRPGTGATA